VAAGGLLHWTRLAAPREGLAMIASVKRIREALQFIPASDRDTWVRMGMAVKSELGDAGFDIWEAWSERDETFDSRAARSVWKSISDNGKVTAGTLFHEAKARGWNDDGTYQRPSAGEVDAMRREAAARTAKADAENAASQAHAATEAAAIWHAAQPASDDHPYLMRKGVRANGAKLYRGALVIGGMPCDGAILVPARDGPAIHSLQFISADGQKRFLPDSRLKGCYFSIGNPNSASALCIAEGVATGSTIRMATGYPVAIAFNAGNLQAVALTMHTKFPDIPIIVCADDDAGTDGNPGLTKAVEAALAVGGKFVTPAFGEKSPDGATDFNDMATHCGADAVKRCIAGAINPVRGKCQAADVVASCDDMDAWPEPLLLPDSLPPVLPFDFDLLPDSLRPWIEDIAERVQCPPDFPAVGAMISLAAVVGRKIGIRPKRQDDWLEVPNLWGAIIGRPGVMKSPALRESMRPLVKLEAREREQFEAAHEEWRRGQEMHKLKREAVKANIVKAMKTGKGFDPDDLANGAEDEPKARRYVVNDCSVEALGEILQANPNGTLAYRDELIGLLKSLDKEGNEGARGFFLSAWSGTDSYTFDRIGRGLNMRIEACCLSLLGSIQPAVIGGYLRQTVATGGGDGLLSRFQLMVWPDISGDWKDVDRWPDSDARDQAFATFERLDSLDPAAIGATLDDGAIPYLRFDPEAAEIFGEWRAGYERTLRAGGDHPAIESHLSKYRKLVPALSLLIHLADNTSGAIGSRALLKALAWLEYLESHARRAYASVAQAEAESARALLRRIKAGEVTNPFTTRDVYRKGWAHLTKPDEAHEAVRYLSDFDYLRTEGISTGGRSKSAIWINPKLRAV